MEVLLFVLFFISALIFFIAGKDDFGRTESKLIKKEEEGKEQDNVAEEGKKEDKVEEEGKEQDNVAEEGKKEDKVKEEGKIEPQEELKKES